MTQRWYFSRGALNAQLASQYKQSLKWGFLTVVFSFGILTSMVCTERIFLVLLIIGSCAAPEVSVLPSFRRARVESPAIVGEWEDARLSVGIATISLGYSYKHNQKGLSKHRCTCLSLFFFIFSLTETDLVSSKGGKNCE